MYKIKPILWIVLVLFMLSCVSADFYKEDHGETDDFTGQATLKRGIAFVANETVNITGAEVYNNAAIQCTHIYLLNSSRDQLENCTISGYNCSFDSPYELQAGTKYYIVADAAGAAHDGRFHLTASFPYTGKYLNWTNGSLDGVDDDRYVLNIQSVFLNVTPAAVDPWNNTILAIGDSVVDNSHVVLTDRWLYKAALNLSTNFGYTGLTQNNQGIGGSCLTAFGSCSSRNPIINRYTADIIQENPRFAFFLMPVNDNYFSVPASEVKSAFDIVSNSVLGNLTSTVFMAGTVWAHVGHQPGNEDDQLTSAQHSAEIREVSIEKGIPLLEVHYLSNHNTSYISDWTHPNTLGSQKFSEWLTEFTHNYANYVMSPQNFNIYHDCNNTIAMYNYSFNTELYNCLNSSSADWLVVKNITNQTFTIEQADENFTLNITSLFKANTYYNIKLNGVTDVVQSTDTNGYFVNIPFAATSTQKNVTFEEAVVASAMNITAYDSYNLTHLQSFNATLTHNGTTKYLGTTTGKIVYTSLTGFTAANITIYKDGYDNVSYTNYNPSTNLNSSINLTLGRLVFNDNIKTSNGSIVSSYSVTVTDRVNSTAYYCTGANNDTICYVPKSRTYTIGVSATDLTSAYLNQTYASEIAINVTNMTLYPFNSINVRIYNFENNSFIVTQNVTVTTISNLTSFINKTNNGTLTLDLLAPNIYELRFSTPNFNSISKFVTVLNDSTQLINVYMTPNTTTSLQVVQVLDTSNQPVESAIIWLQQEVINGSESWVTVQEAETDFSGSTTLFVERDTTIFYRFAVIFDGQARPIQPSGNLFTTKTSFIPGVTETITLVIDTEESVDTIIEDRLNVQTDMVLESDNLTFNFTWLDGGNTVAGARLIIEAKYINSTTNYVEISNTNSSASFGSLTYTMTPINNTVYRARGYLIYNNREEFVEELVHTFDIDVLVNKYTGLLYGFLIVAAVALLTLRFGAFQSTMITTAVLFAVNLFGIMSVPVSMITGFGCLCVILFMEVSKS